MTSPPQPCLEASPRQAWLWTSGIWRSESRALFWRVIGFRRPRAEDSLANTSAKEYLAKRRPLHVCLPGRANSALEDLRPGAKSKPQQQRKLSLGHGEGEVGRQPDWSEGSIPPGSRTVRTGPPPCYTDLARIHRKRTDALADGCLLPWVPTARSLRRQQGLGAHRRGSSTWSPV